MFVCMYVSAHLYTCICRGPPVSIHPIHWWGYRHAPCAQLSCRCWGFELRASWIHSKHITYGVSHPHRPYGNFLTHSADANNHCCRCFVGVRNESKFYIHSPRIFLIIDIVTSNWVPAYSFASCFSGTKKAWLIKLSAKPATHRERVVAILALEGFRSFSSGLLSATEWMGDLPVGRDLTAQLGREAIGTQDSSSVHWESQTPGNLPCISHCSPRKSLIVIVQSHAFVKDEGSSLMSFFPFIDLPI